MKYILTAVALCCLLAGCQGIVGSNGQITGITVPPGCTSHYEIVIAGVQSSASLHGDCSEPATATSTSIMLKP